MDRSWDHHKFYSTTKSCIQQGWYSFNWNADEIRMCSPQWSPDRFPTLTLRSTEYFSLKLTNAFNIIVEWLAELFWDHYNFNNTGKESSLLKPISFYWIVYLLIPSQKLTLINIPPISLVESKAGCDMIRKSSSSQSSILQIDTSQVNPNVIRMA